MSTLIIYLSHGSSTPHAATPAVSAASTQWPYVLSADAQTPLQHGCAAANLLPVSGRSTAVVLLVPVQKLSWHTVELPAGVGHRSGARLRSVLEGLLEDRLLQEPDKVHLALGPDMPGEGRRRWVAGCDKAWLNECMQVLQAAGLRITRVVPEFWPRVLEQPALYAMGVPEQAHWVLWGRTPEDDSVLHEPATEQGSLPAMWQALSVSQRENLRVWAEPGVVQWAQSALGTEGSDRQVQVQTSAQRWLEALDSGWELAQHELARTKQVRWQQGGGRIWQSLVHGAHWRAWRWGVLALLGVHWAGMNVWAWQEKQALKQRQVQIRSILQTTFPHVSLVVDAPLQMAREVANLGHAAGQAGPADVETLLGAVQAGVPAGVVPTEIDYASGELRLRGLELSAQASEQLQTSLSLAGYQARQEGNQWVVSTTAGVRR